MTVGTAAGLADIDGKVIVLTGAMTAGAAFAIQTPVQPSWPSAHE